MAFDFEKFCGAYGVEIAPAGNKHARSGWLNVHCPFCVGSRNYHLGFEIARDRFRCWRCGPHKSAETVAKLANVTIGQAFNLIKDYGGRTRVRRTVRKIHKQDITVELPPGAEKMRHIHRHYLSGRGYDPAVLEDTWGLLGTRNTGTYGWRIVAPIYFQGKLVSYQCRDITEKHGLKYMACKKENEAREHQSVVYGYDLVPRDTVVICEGIADVWRLGPGAVATFGIDWTQPQANILRSFSTRLVLFDAQERAAAKSAEKLATYLSAFEGVTEVLELEGASDPGDMDQSDADAFMKEIMGATV